MATCDRCQAPLSLYEYNRVDDSILCDQCAKGGITMQAEVDVDLSSDESETGFQLFERYESEQEALKDEALLKEKGIAVYIKSQDTCSKSLLSKKNIPTYLLYISIDNVHEASTLLRYDSEEGVVVLLRNAPHLLWIRRCLYVMMFLSLYPLYRIPGVYCILLGFLSFGIALTKDMEWNVSYLCSNRKCRSVNRKDAQFCTHCGAHFEMVEYRESNVERFKKRAWR